MKAVFRLVDGTTVKLEGTADEIASFIATRERVSKTSVASCPLRLVAPESDTERYYKECIEVADGSLLTATELYEDYCTWCELRNKEPATVPKFGRVFAELGVSKKRIAGCTRYIGVALRAALRA